MTAKIGLEDVRIHAPHGFFEEEHLMGNEFSIDVEVEANIAGAAQNDDLGGTVNYATIYYLIQAEMKKPTHPEDDGFEDDGLEFDIPEAGEMADGYDDEEMDDEDWDADAGFDDLDLGDFDLGDFDLNDLD